MIFNVSLPVHSPSMLSFTSPIASSPPALFGHHGRSRWSDTVGRSSPQSGAVASPTRASAAMFLIVHISPISSSCTASKTLCRSSSFPKNRDRFMTTVRIPSGHEFLNLCAVWGTIPLSRLSTQMTHAGFYPLTRFSRPIALLQIR